ncbi:hypothetical protein F5X98DRAFT_250119 [Xylaria grammica]|nr:hypothetical protein F5X98DRAFT_250119 [Xylaria grammica]
MESNTDFDATKRTWAVVRETFTRLVGLQAPHLTNQDLNELRIICTGLDLSTGEPADGSEVFIRPSSTARIRSILERTKPWLHCPLLDEKDSAPEVAAMQIHGCLISALVWGVDGSTPLMMQTDWQRRYMRYDEGERLQRFKVYGTADWAEWRVELLIEKTDGSTPHISCLLADDALLRDDQLSHAEIWCIIAITVRRLREYYKHRIIPVTVISAADRQLRIVQGYLDGRDGYLRARKSPILDFSQYDREKMELVLSWCVGDAVGHTGP